MWKIKRIRQKINSNKGFTLAETLLAMLILLMVSTIVASGIPVVQNAYVKVVLASNADVVLSTTISTLRNELGTAQEVDVPETEGNTIITYYNGTRGATSQIYVDSLNPEQGIMFQRYYKQKYNNEAGQNVAYPVAPLVSEKTATSQLYVTYDSVTMNEGIVTFSNLQVKRVSEEAPLTAVESLSIRVISN